MQSGPPRTTIYLRSDHRSCSLADCRTWNKKTGHHISSKTSHAMGSFIENKEYVS